MKALVVGGSGLIGGALVRALERSGFEVLSVFRSRAVPNGRALDVRDPEAVRQYVSDVRPDVIFLAIIMSGGVDYIEMHPEEGRALEARSVENIATAARATEAGVVYYSTDYIFDGKAGPYSEEDAPSPLSVYGQAKWEAEQALQALVPRHLIVRTTSVFGWDRASRNFAMQVWDRLAAGQRMRVADDQWGNPTLAEYLAEASLRLVQLGAEGVYNVVGKDRLTRAEMGRALARAMALDPALIEPGPTTELAQHAPRPLEGGLRTDKLTRTLGTEPLDLRESLKRFRRQWRGETHVAPGPRIASTDAERLKQEILDGVRRYYGLAHRPSAFIPYQSRIQYSGRVFGEDEMVNLVDSALDFWLTLGPYGDVFERRMRGYFDAADFVVVNSGSTANLTAIMTLMSRQVDRPLQPGDEVITPAVTFPTTLAPIVHGGLIPVFVDCEIGTYNINPRLLEGAVSARTRAIMVPHTLGNPCDLDVVCDVAKRHGLYVIEDACDALGGTFQGKRLGSFGDLATLSFFPAHHITMGEGGGVVVNNPRLTRTVRSVRDWGRDCWCAPGESNTCGRRFGWELGDLPRGYDHKYIYSTIGYNFKPTDMQAAIGIAQFDRLEDFVERRRRNFVRLYRGLECYQPTLVLPAIDPRANPSWFGFPITVSNGVNRDALVQWLETANIETRQIFGGNILKQPAYRDIPRRIYGSLDESNRIMRDAFFIGVYPGLEAAQLDFIIDRIAAFFAG